MENDLISRKATIYAMENVDWYHISKDGQLVHGANSDDHEPLYKAKDVYAVLNKMPSVQPEVLGCGQGELVQDNSSLVQDCISRKAAIEALEKSRFPGAPYIDRGILIALREIKKLSSAQPEILKDGTLMIDVPDLDTVNRVIVSSGKWCKVFYMDDSERKTDG